jgi:hypothetical protein
VRFVECQVVVTSSALAFTNALQLERGDQVRAVDGVTTRMLVKPYYGTTAARS